MARRQQIVETDTGELILYNSYAHQLDEVGSQKKGASRLKAGGRNKSSEPKDAEE